MPHPSTRFTCDEKDEALVVSLFKMQPNSPTIDTALKLLTIDQVPSLSLEEGVDQDRPVPKLDRNPASLSQRKEVDMRLKVVEQAFLVSQDVATPDVQLASIADRFSESSIPEDVNSVPQYIDKLITSAVNDAIHTGAPTMIGHMTSSLPYFSRPLSRLIAAMNQNVVKTETGNTVTFLEREAMAQLHRAIYNRDSDFYEQHGQNPEVVLGLFTSGGTLANISALWVARNAGLGPETDEQGNVVFEGIEKCGVFQSMMYHKYTGFAVIGSKLLHYSMSKAVDVLGLGTDSLVSVDYDENFQVNPADVEAAIQRCREQGRFVVAIMGIAGATETGSIDPLDGLADLASKYDIHFHVDAAWGGPLMFSKKHSPKLKGIERADSVTLDGHKQLYLPMGCGMMFLQDPFKSHAVRKSANYIIRKDSYDLGKFTMEGSRPANAIYLHSNLNILGVRGYELLVDRGCRMASYMASKIEQRNDMFLLVKPSSNILLYQALPPNFRDCFGEDGRCKDSVTFTDEQVEEINEYNRVLQSLQKMRGKTFVSRTTIKCPLKLFKGKSVAALRVVIANPLTYETDIDRVMNDQLEIMYAMDNGHLAKTENDEELLQVIEKIQQQTNTNGTEGSEYWSKYFDQAAPEEVKLLFKHNKALFLETLLAPSNKLESDQGGIKHDPRYSINE